jgi:hypothetical protein
MNLTLEAFEAACKGGPKNGIYNIGGDEMYTYASLLDTALRTTNLKATGPIEFGWWKFNPTRPASIDGYVYGKFNPYWITLDRIDTIEKLAHWVDHLHEKVWFSPYETDTLANYTDGRFAADYHSARNFLKVIVALNGRGLLVSKSKTKRREEVANV